MAADATDCRTKRCAIYTRKSSEEGLEQDFNSLDAQREACEAYVLSQKHEGWDLLPDRFDDGGVSGGTMDRPALRRLLKEIEAGRIDVIVVYKVDRLTRSLSDFARIVDVFDRHTVSFVSVTQQFNTTSSMGRLTLNVLLSFAQFEREVTGERIRDKIAASKKKGMWMGGFVPLGYDARDRRLIINEQEAETVREIFRLYLEKKNVRLLQEELDQRGFRTKRTMTAKGKDIGGGTFSRGHLYRILSNPIYIGEIMHKKTRYPGQHAPIIDTDTWDLVQRTLKENLQGTRRSTNARAPSLLAGLLHDEAGNRFQTNHAVSSGNRYRYYVVSDGALSPTRLPAHEVESAVCSTLAEFLSNSDAILEKLHLEQTEPANLKVVLEAAHRLAGQLRSGTETTRQATFDDLISRITVSPDTLRIELRREHLLGNLDRPEMACAANEACVSAQPLVLKCPVKLANRGAKTKLMVDRDWPEHPPKPDAALIKAVARGHVWFEDLASGRYSSVRELCGKEGVDESTVAKFLRLAFLSPDIVRQILKGHQSSALTRGRLIAWGSWPINWANKEAVHVKDPK